MAVKQRTRSGVRTSPAMRKHHPGGQRSYDSTGPEGKIRGTALQVHERYCQLARDALAGGDRVGSEICYQYSEHYYRLALQGQGGALRSPPVRGYQAEQPPVPVFDGPPPCKPGMKQPIAPPLDIHQQPPGFAAAGLEAEMERVNGGNPFGDND